MRSGGPRGRLRGELMEFAGQRAELAAVRQALGAARLVTLTGPGGIGKTRLAVEVAPDLVRHVSDIAQFPRRVVAAVSPEPDGSSPDDRQ